MRSKKDNVYCILHKYKGLGNLVLSCEICSKIFIDEQVRLADILRANNNHSHSS